MGGKFLLNFYVVIIFLYDICRQKQYKLMSIHLEKKEDAKKEKRKIVI